MRNHCARIGESPWRRAMTMMIGVGDLVDGCCTASADFAARSSAVHR